MSEGIVPRKYTVPQIGAHPPEGSGMPPEATEDSGMRMHDVLASIKRRFWIVAVFSLGGLALAFNVVRHIIPMFEARAVIQVRDPAATLAPSLVGRGSEDGLTTQLQIFKSRAVLGPVVDIEGLRITTADPASDIGVITHRSTSKDVAPGSFELSFKPDSYHISGSYGSLVASYGDTARFQGIELVARGAAPAPVGFTVIEREIAVDRLALGLRLTPRPGTPVVDISFQSPDPQLARRVVNTAVGVFRDYAADAAKQESVRKRLFVEEQLGATNAMLRAAQEEMSAFRRREKVLSLDSRFSAEQATLTSIELRRQENLANREVYTKLLAGMESPDAQARALNLQLIASSPEFADNVVISNLYGQLIRAETQRDAIKSGPFGASKTSPEVESLNDEIAALTERLRSAIRIQKEFLDVRLQATEALQTRAKAAIERLPDVLSEEERLAQQISSISGLADQLQSEYQRAKLSEAVEVGSVEVVDLATLPRTPLPTGGQLKVVLGLLSGLIVGVIVAVLVESMDSTVRRREDVTSALRLSDLGFVPRLTSTTPKSRFGLAWPGSNLARRLNVNGRNLPAVVTSVNDMNVAHEAYTSIRTNLLFSQHVSEIKTLLVTSAAPGEGKTMTAANLARAYSRHGFRVILVDCDLRRASIHRSFGLDRTPGVSDVVVGLVSPSAGIQSTTTPGLDIMAAGTAAPNAPEILGSSAMTTLLSNLSTEYDLVIIDTPPIGVGSDAAILSVRVDAVLIVIRAGMTDRKMVRRAVRELRTVGARIVGAVLNDADGTVTKFEGNKYGYYGYAYTSSDSSND